MNFPEDLYYSETHEWAKREDNDVVTIGITDFAQKELGDIVYVELVVELNSKVNKGDELISIESVKAVDSAFAPVSGHVIEFNSDLEDQYEKVNKAPYTEGWLVKIKMTDPSELEQLMNAQQYQEFIKKEK